MINAIPFFGWFLSLFFAIGLAVPFWFIWTVCGIGQTYAYWLPAIYQTPGFWARVGIFICTSIIKAVFVPKFGSVSSTSEVAKK